MHAFHGFSLRQKRSSEFTVMSNENDAAPDSTAARVALWRALHVEIDPPPHVLEDEIGLKLLAPDQDWRHRGDMDPQFTRPFRASIVARARFIEDLVLEQADRGLRQYVLLGAGLDSFAQRRPEIVSGTSSIISSIYRDIIRTTHLFTHLLIAATGE
jgi:O-methyltransferase involved in polyketide biosynthesis